MDKVSRAKPDSLWDQCPVLLKEFWKLHKFLSTMLQPTGLKPNGISIV